IYHSRYINLEILQKLDNMLSPYIYKYSKDSPSNRQIYLQFLANRYFTIAYSTETLGLILKTVKEIKNSHHLSLFELQLISKVVNKSDDRVDQKLIKRLKEIVEDYILNTIKNNQNELYTIINDSILKRDILNAVTSEVIFEIIKTISYNINTENDNDKWLRGFLALISSNKIQENKELCKRIRNLTIIKKLESEDNEIINYIETILGIKT
ncbi:hypothetical protein J7J90_04510, partial [Candidatus Micrarchaeota archaeon]|nr:hypothetical protein [Candidatus Micrarchaeota archaeon]